MLTHWESGSVLDSQEDRQVACTLIYKNNVVISIFLKLIEKQTIKIDRFVISTIGAEVKSVPET